MLIKTSVPILNEMHDIAHLPLCPTLFVWLPSRCKLGGGAQGVEYYQDVPTEQAVRGGGTRPCMLQAHYLCGALIAGTIFGKHMV